MLLSPTRVGPASVPVRWGSGPGGWRQSGPLLRTDPGTGWRGYGLRTVDTEEWQAWLLGEPLPASLVVGGWGPDLEPSRLVAALRGSFLLLAHHRPSATWHAWTDRFGSIHAYHGLVPADGAGPARAALGTFSPAVATVASARRLDWEGLAGWCSFGFFPADRTQFTDVRLLGPATHTAFAADGTVASRDRWWTWASAPDLNRSYDRTVDAVADRLASVLADELDASRPGRLAVPISGGLDSRTTVALLTVAGTEPDPALWAYSYGWSDRSVETAIAEQVARARGLPFERSTIGPYLWNQLDRAVDATEAMIDLTLPRQLGVIDEVAARADHVLAAHWGDVWLDDVHRTPDTDPVDDLLHRMAKPGRSWLVEHLCGPHLGGPEQVEPLLRSFVEGELAAREHLADEDFRVKAVKTDTWSHRWTLASLRAHRCATTPWLPFYDPELTDLLATVPSAWTAGRRLQVDVICRLAPDLAAITWQATGTDLRAARRPRLGAPPGSGGRAPPGGACGPTPRRCGTGRSSSPPPRPTSVAGWPLPTDPSPAWSIRRRRVRWSTAWSVSRTEPPAIPSRCS